MKLNYSMEHRPLLDVDARDRLIGLMKDAGIRKVWIAGFFSGKMIDTAELIEARAFAERHGLEVGAVTIPIGHPGNALNPDDPDLEHLEIPKHWHYRIDKSGETVYYCGAIDASLIEDNAQAARKLREAGFKEVFLDDDLRNANFGPDIEGCYCEACIAEFNRIYERRATRESLRDATIDKRDADLMLDWVAFQCGKVTDVVEATDIDGVRPGIMVMHYGDERHGIDVPSIRARIPDTIFRVGELHFNDGTFGSPNGKAQEMMGIAYHLNFMAGADAYSESTIFPPRSLKPHNLVYKAKMAITAGIENVLFMSGTWLLDESYWNALAAARPALEALDQACSDTVRSYPVHVAYGTSGAYSEAFIPTTLPVLAGLPAKPVRADQTCDDGELLLFFGAYRLSEQWLAKLPAYKQVVFDRIAAEANKDMLERLGPSASHIVFWDREASSANAAEGTAQLRELVSRSGASWQFPWVAEGENIGLTWLADSGKAVLSNLAETESEGVVNWSGTRYPVVLKPLSFAVLERSGAYVEYDSEVAP
ncbi:hypothetical protein [Paenibacillus sacheonensis]|uniref:Beta-galactosidase trimerisation domain-containing protein n=1 Tax=Paenibacillus sacheonensis TaxID=742054 RepID=A0A7X4YRP5_9BACL|nr:hypothetical protein [Paenibacillus sacheonensis]MBM7566193.1 formylmethanofuran:tetrahydromethanopterin formyltransferase [Paenibacillus sacheonensis]NBC70401.1 hypothetical protein [Paenibacillus sacheonensis]